MSQKRPVDGFKWVKDLSKFNESFIKNYDENSNKGHFLEIDVWYPKKSFNLHKDLPFLPERAKLAKVKKLLCSLEDKKEDVIHIRALKQALNRELILKKIHRVIQFNQNAWFKPYIYINTKLKKKQNMNLKKISLSS